MADGLTIEVNGAPHVVQASPDTPLLYIVQNELLHSGRGSCKSGWRRCSGCQRVLRRDGRAHDTAR